MACVLVSCSAPGEAPGAEANNAAAGDTRRSSPVGTQQHGAAASQKPADRRGPPAADATNGEALGGKRLDDVRHVILVTIDTLRADQLGVHGGPAQTPVLDALARSGWWFRNCISASMLTNPSHASIMTSLYPRDHGVFDNQSGIASGVPTLAQAAAEAGASTGAVIGFPHLNPNVSNLGQGFEKVVRATRAERRAPRTSRVALDLLDTLRAERPHEPVFMWVHYVDPHAPYEPPPSHPPDPVTQPHPTPLHIARRAAPGFQRHNAWFADAFGRYDSVEALIHRYVAEIEATDSGLGELVAGLRQRGLAANTAVVVTSDHGENLGERNLFFHHGGLYRQTVHVPLIVGFPDGEPVAGPRRVDGLVETVDIAPMVLELLGAQPWTPMRGRNPTVAFEQRGTFRRVAHSEHMLAQQVAVRTRRTTLIRHRKTSAQFPTYPFEAGRTEWVVNADAPKIDTASERSVLAEALQRYLVAGLAMQARPAVNQDRESLRALGYIE